MIFQRKNLPLANSFGVKKEVIKGKSGYKRDIYLVPEKFKDNQEKLEEIKKLFHIYTVKYYQVFLCQCGFPSL